MMNTKSAFAVFLAAFAVCADGAELKFLNDIPYRTTCRTSYQRDRCKLDIRYMKGSTGFPTVVWFHGGGLTAGSKHFVKFSDATFGEVAVNYRLMNATNGVQGADCIDDAAAAVAWTLEHIAEYGGSSEEMFRRVASAYSAFAERHGLEIIPVGAAVRAFGDSDLLFTKPDFHLNLQGKYLQGLVWVAALFRVDVSDCRYLPKWLEPQMAGRLKASAMKAVRETTSRTFCPRHVGGIRVDLAGTSPT